MPSRFPNRPSLARRPLPPRRDVSGRADPLYGYGYNPAWPSILSVAHDESNGGRVFVITDRPCALVSASPAALPLTIPGLDVVEAVEVLPIKFRLWLSDAVPLGAAWAWAADGAGIVDPITGHVLNAGGGYCADFPGPYAPPPPPSVVSAYGSGTTAVLVFDRPVAVNGSPVDDAVTINGMTPSSVGNADAYSLSFALGDFVSAGDPWALTRQPDWLATVVAWPAAGVLG